MSYMLSGAGGLHAFETVTNLNCICDFHLRKFLTSPTNSGRSDHGIAVGSNNNRTSCH